MLVKSVGPRGTLLGAFVPTDLANQFGQLARELHDPPADAVVHAIPMYVANGKRQKAA